VTLHGTWFVVPTAFTDDGEVDFAGQRQVVNAAIGWGVDGLTVMGVMSEAALLTAAERRMLLEAIFEEAAERVPIVVGCAAGGDRPTVELVEQAASAGASAAMVAPPALHRNVADLPAFFAEVSRRGGLPVVIQDEPRAYGVVMPPALLAEACAAAKALAVKLEDPPTPEKIGRLLALQRGETPVFGGLGGVSALWELRRGACGTMTGFSFPEVLATVRIAHEDGDGDRAAAIFDRYLPLIQYEAQVGIGLTVRKELLRRRGALPSAASRLFPRGIDARMPAELDDILRRLSLEPSAARLEIT